jgi:hypothetical protein
VRNRFDIAQSFLFRFGLDELQEHWVYVYSLTLSSNSNDFSKPQSIIAAASSDIRARS